MFPRSAMNSLKSGGGGFVSSKVEESLQGFQPHLDLLIEARSRGSDLIYPNEMRAAEEVLKICIDSGIRWCLLLAQMQSGKTMTYYFVIAEMLRLKKVEKAVIFSGSSEKELKTQVEESKTDFFIKYEEYLRNVLGMSEKDARDLCDERRDPEKSLPKKIQVLWSSDLKKYKTPPINTFFVWDESHYAQNNGMRPGEFLRKLGICPTGDSETLLGLGSYFLSVSATPLSEISDIHHKKQEKYIVNMIPGENYYGVKNMIEMNKLKAYDADPLEQLELALKLHYNEEGPSYAVTRISSKYTLEQIKEVASRNGWKGVQYDSKIKGIMLSDDFNSGRGSSLRSAPREHILIILKGMLRMGKRIIKKHVSFAMEMSLSSNGDTSAQGLIGRFCGYDANRETVVYVHIDVFNDIIKYSNYMNSDGNCQELPTGRNLIPGTSSVSRSNYYEIIPIEMKIQDQDDTLCDANREQLIEAVRVAIVSGNIEDLNDKKQSEEIMFQVRNFRDEQFKICNVKRENISYSEVPRKIRESIDSLTPIKLGAGCCSKAYEDMKIFVFHEDYPEHGIRRGQVFLDTRTREASFKQKMNQIAKTNEKEVFAGLKDETVQELNQFQEEQMQGQMQEQMQVQMQGQMQGQMQCLRGGQKIIPMSKKSKIEKSKKYRLKIVVEIEVNVTVSME
jgi:hypothetical protein